MDKVVFSFFSGSGFLDLGFEKQGFETVFVNEFHKPFLDAYKYSRKEMGITPPSYGYHCCSIDSFLQDPIMLSSLKQAVQNERQNGNVVIFIGGPPCPDFSVGGKNKGKDGENGRLTESYIHLIIECKPDFFLFENVKGLWRTKRHRAFYEEMKCLLQSNGFITENRLCNSIEFGAPQDRDRIILIGFNRCTIDLKKQFTDGVCWNEVLTHDKDEVFSYKWPIQTKFVKDSVFSCTDDRYIELTVQHWFEKNSVHSHPNSKNYFTPRAGLAKFLVIDEGDVYKKSYKRLHRWRYSPTAAYGNNEVHLHPYKARRISAAEALAIQSLPSEFSLPQDMSLSNMFKTIGNGVPYLMARGLAKLVDSLIENTSTEGADNC